MALAACGDSKPVGTVGHIKGFAGMVAADEPRAVISARDVLSAGGTAADAAVALYFTLAVTYPSTASLGGGGVCLVHDRATGRTEALDFIAPPSGAAGEVPTAIPASPRGFFALHAKYGKMKWESLLAEPERISRMGVPVSRALATELARSQDFLARNAEAKGVVFRTDGAGVLREGDMIQQPELSSVIARVRRNTGDFYAGMQARDLVTAVKAAGGTLSLDDLRDYKPQWRETLKVQIGNETAHFAPPPAVGSTVAAQLVGALWGSWRSAAAEERPHLLAETAARAFTDRGGWMQPNGTTSEQAPTLISAKRIEALSAGYSGDRHQPTAGAPKPSDAQVGTGFAIIDSFGSAVACSLTSYGAFGSGRMAPGTGIFLAGVPGPNGPPAVAPMLSVNANSREVHFAGAASGGVTAPTALAAAFLASESGASLADAVSAPRVHNNATPDITFVEAGSRAADAGALQRRGHQTSAVERMPSRVNAVQCPTGRLGAQSCTAATDPRGHGMAVEVGKNK